MRQLVFIALVVAALLGALALPVASQTADSDSGTLSVEMSPKFVISLLLRETGVQYTNFELSASNTARTMTLSQQLELTNTGDVPVDLLIGGTNATSTGGNTWTLNCDPSDLGTVGPDQYVLRVAIGSDGQAICPGTDDLWVSGVLSQGVIDYKIILHSPTSTSDYGKHTSSVTITALQVGP